MIVIKVASQFFMLLEQASVQFQQVQQYLVNLRRDIGDKVKGVREAVRARRYYLPQLRRGCAAVTAVIDKGIEKVKPHICTLKEAAAVIGQQVQQNLVKSGVAAGYKARQVGATVRTRRYYLPELRSGCAAVIAAMNKGIEKVKPYISKLREAATVIGQQAQQNLVKSSVAVGYKARQIGATVRARQYYLPELRTAAAAVTSMANDGIKKVRSQLYVPLEHCTRYVRKAGDKVTSAGREIADIPRKMRETRHTRENELRNLLATSVDAIVVTDEEHRVVAANTNALELLGVSEGNIRNFTLDSFISKGQIPGFNGDGASFKRGNCQIRRLNGNLRLADYEFTANHLPSRNLCIFRNVSCKTIRPIARTNS